MFVILAWIFLLDKPMSDGFQLLIRIRQNSFYPEDTDPDSQPCKKGRAGNLLICSSLIRSFRSNQMSDCEGFAQIAQDKWATMS